MNIQRVAVQIHHLGTGQHHAVMVRFVAVTVYQYDVAGPHQALHDDLVTGRCSVGGKKGVLGTEGARGKLLGFLDGAMRFQQTIEAARGCRRFRQEKSRQT